MSSLVSALFGCLLIFCAVVSPARAEEDLREAVTLPPEVKDAFLAEMRGHMGNLDDILLAIAEGDFKAAADIADITMDFGHRMWEGQRHGGQGSGQGRGFGRFMPEAFRAMGQGFHEAAAQFAVKARAVGPNPSAADYQRVLGHLQQITAACRGCHDAFRIE